MATSPSRVVVVMAVVCVALIIVPGRRRSRSTSGGVAQAETTTEPIHCRDCDKACKESCKGNTSWCGGICDDPSSAGCESCKEAYYSKCVNYCGSSCSHVCVN